MKPSLLSPGDQAEAKAIELKISRVSQEIACAESKRDGISAAIDSRKRQLEKLKDHLARLHAKLILEGDFAGSCSQVEQCRR